MPAIHDAAFESAPLTPMNQDRGFIDIAHRACGVFDGMRGGANGDVAAELAKQHIEREIQHLSPPHSQIEGERAIRMLLCNATAALSTHAREQENDMGTTASICILVPAQKKKTIAVIGNVGDSRVYAINPRGQLQQITIDDSYVRIFYQDEQEARTVQVKLNNATAWKGLSKKEVWCFSQRHLMSQVLGDATIEPRIHTVPVGHGWSLLLTTDGVHDNLTDDEMQTIVRAIPTARNAVRALLRAADERSRSGSIRSNRDDMTALMIRL